MNILTYGAARDRLLELGYFACSAPRPDVRGYLAADDPCAVLCCPPIGHAARPVVALTVTTKDPALRKKILAIVAKHGLAGGPVRQDSAGNEMRPLRCDEYSPPMQRSSATADGEFDPALALDSWSSKGFGSPHESALIRLDGKWQGGHLLSTPRSALPVIDSDGIDALFKELLVGVFPRAPYVDPRVPESELPANLRKVHEPRMAAPRSKMDFRGGTVSMIELAKTDGSWDSLPDLPPPEKEPA